MSYLQTFDLSCLCIFLKEFQTGLVIFFHTSSRYKTSTTYTVLKSIVSTEY